MHATRAVDASRRLESPLRRIIQEGDADDLARRAVRGDRAAFTALMTAHKDQLYRFVRRRMPNSEDACDVVQEAFVAAWKAIGRFDPDRSFGVWLRSIALNKCRDRARRAVVRRALLGSCSSGAAELVRDEALSPEDDLIVRDDLAALARAMAALPAHLRDALMLTAVDGMSQTAASTILGCSVKSIEYRVHRAREMLAQQLTSA
jgi:RNA polymerase sigma-70 factor (ECF subfamily)